MATEVDVSSGPIWAEKDKDATRTYSFDLTSLLPAGDLLVSCTWAVTPAGGASALSSSTNGNVALVTITGGAVQTWYAFTATWTTASGDTDQFTLRLFIKVDPESVPSLGSALFPNRFTATKKLRADRLLLAASGAMPQVSVSDDYLWDKLVAAESEIGHRLRVPLQLTQFFANQPAQSDIDALNGMPWAIDPGYDYDPESFRTEKWGFIITRQKPIYSVSRVRFVYPGPAQGVFDLPLDWLRMDKKYGHIRFVPSSTAFAGPFSAFLMQMLGGGRMIPMGIELTYVAGLENAARDFPELVDVVQKMAVLKIIGDAFLPTSGSISADGLSQSMSVDMAKYHESIDTIIDGPKGSNGGLMSAIHGIRLGVLGA